MRKVFLCALVVFGFMNFSFGQGNVKSERISIKKYDEKGLIEQFHLRGDKALAFDIPAYIKENQNAERLVIKGAFRTNLSTSIIHYDSNLQSDLNGDYVCQDIVSKKTPFLGVYGTGRSDKSGVDVKRIIPTTSAEKAGMQAGEIITEFDGKEITNFSELQKAVLASQIGEKVDLQLHTADNQYSKSVIVGSRGLETITYNVCADKPITESNTAKRSAATFTAYPNPTNALSQINFTSSSDEDVTFTVTDITGRLIHNKIYTQFEGNLSLDYDFDTNVNGTYILTIQQGKEVYNRKVQLIKE